MSGQLHIESCLVTLGRMQRSLESLNGEIRDLEDAFQRLETELRVVVTERRTPAEQLDFEDSDVDEPF